jgi:predicted RNase H-like HicB family nuclease
MARKVVWPAEALQDIQEITDYISKHSGFYAVAVVRKIVDLTRQMAVAEVPELAGCAGDGPTYAEALANVEVVIDEWISTARDLGRDIPQPRGRLMFA